jgi:hypothetical protein
MERAGPVCSCRGLKFFTWDAGDEFLGVCGEGVRHRFGDGSRSVHNVKSVTSQIFNEKSAFQLKY